MLGTQQGPDRTRRVVLRARRSAGEVWGLRRVRHQRRDAFVPERRGFRAGCGLEVGGPAQG